MEIGECDVKEKASFFLNGVGEIGNYYGDLALMTLNDKHYWAIENWDGYYWEEIPKYLFDSLIKYHEDFKGE